MTPSQQLAAIIGAQTAGGSDTYGEIASHFTRKWQKQFNQWRLAADGKDVWKTDGEEYQDVFILEILLDVAGLKAAYGEEYPENWSCVPGTTPPPFCNTVARKILDTWLSNNGDAAKTIETAYNLLPTHA